MELLSLNEIRSLGHRVPPSKSLPVFVYAVLTQAMDWARRTQRQVKPYEPNWRQLESRWQALCQAQGEHGATLSLARYVESRLTGN